MSDGPLYVNSRVRVKPGICKLIKRTLKGPGTILARKNTEIAPHDVLGRYKLTGGFSQVNVARELGISPSEARQFVKKVPGQTVFKGELLAQKKTLFGSSQIISPTDAIFEKFDDNSGVATLKFIPKDVALTSGVFGVVEDVNAARGEITIKCMTTEIYGLVGTGGEREGFLNVICGQGDFIDGNKINTAHRGQILVAGSLVGEDVIKRALGNNVHGVICGGLNTDDYLSMAFSLNPGKRLGTEIGISIMSTEGFGLIPIGDDIFEILNKHNSRFAMIHGNLGRILLPSGDPDSILSCRKVGMPEKEAQGVRPELSISELKQGLKVRLIWPPYMGSQGIVREIDKTPTALDSGISTYLLTIETKSRKIKVPYSNVEAIL